MFEDLANKLIRYRLLKQPYKDKTDAFQKKNTFQEWCNN